MGRETGFETKQGNKHKLTTPINMIIKGFGCF